jgi:hypothetical protein
MPSLPQDEANLAGDFYRIRDFSLKPKPLAWPGRAHPEIAGQSTSDKKGMWADSSFEDLIQYNDGFRTGLIGTAEQVAQRIVDYRKLGVDVILTGFLHYHEEVEQFGRDVIPIVRELEIENGLDPAAVPDPAEGLTDTEPLVHVSG